MAVAMLCSNKIVFQDPIPQVGHCGTLSIRCNLLPFHGLSPRSKFYAGSSSQGGTIRRLSCGLSGRGRSWVRAGVAQSRVAQSTPSKEDNSRAEQIENGRILSTSPTGVELNLVEGLKRNDEEGSAIFEQEADHGKFVEEKSGGLLGILARDIEVLSKNVGTVEEAIQVVPEGDLKELLNGKLGVGDDILETAESKGAGVVETLTRDAEFIKDSVFTGLRNARNLWLASKEEVGATIQEDARF